jgi:pimeloyl-ACP methyl ester carboxylesterase
MKRTKIRLASGILVAGALVLAGNASSGPPAPLIVAERPAGSYREVTCPPEVTRNAVVTARCGFLTVPESRGKLDGRTIELFVVREWPSGPLRPDPVLALQELGSTRAWTGPDYLPPRVHREVITVDHRGLGRSRPSLACPEVERLARSSMAAPINDPRTRASLLRAVTACRDRLAREGVDLGAYNLTEMAADAEDLRLALGIERWNLRGLGSGARIAFEILRRHGAHVRAVWLDSPEIPQLDFLTTGIVGTKNATMQLAAACAGDRACNKRFPGLGRVLARNLQAAERRPMTVRGKHDGTAIPIVLDGGTLLRAHREGLAWAPELGPAALDANSLRDARQGYDWLADGPVFTLGYGIDPGREDSFSHGAYFSTVCHDQLPFVSRSALVALTRRAPAYREAFADSPFAGICRRWSAGQARRGVHAPVTSDVPVLMFVGRFDPYGPPAVARQAARTLKSSWVVELPNKGYNGLAGSYCALAARNAWLDNPTSPPKTGCIKRLRIRFLLR